MSKISSSLLTDTLNVVALARETALARGVKDQADRLTPVVDGLRTVATAARRAQPAARPAEVASAAAATPAPANKTVAAAAPAEAAAPVQPAGVLAQGDFQAMLAAAQKAPLSAPAAASGAAQDRGQVVAAMAAGGMGEVDIARQLGASREEIRLMLNNQGSSAGRASWTNVKAYWR